MVWFNEAAVQASTFSNLSIDWEGSLGSDHVLLRIMGQPCQPLAPQAPDEGCPGFVIDPEWKNDWIQCFTALSLPLLLPALPTMEEVEREVTNLVADIQMTNEQTFHEHHPPHARAASWSNAACAVAAQNLHAARGTAMWGTAQAHLKGVVHAAKWQWAEDFIGKANLWDVAAW